MTTKSDLMYDFPENLIAKTPSYPPRVIYKSYNQKAKEISFSEITDLFRSNDLLLINKTKVLPRRIFLKNFDILFLESSNEKLWTVLFPARKFKIDDIIKLPEGIELKLLSKGRPQLVLSNKSLNENYFKKYAHFALPPYIQNARGMSLPMDEDQSWYQTCWAKVPGSLAAPTASLHFKESDLTIFKSKIEVAELTLHVGLGTFLPVGTENLSEHKMHHEYVEIEKVTIAKIKKCKALGGRIWTLGTTSLRSVEAWSRGHLEEFEDKFAGQTDLFLKPGDNFNIASGLLTNFHQPGSTLIALVSAFSSLQEVKTTYQYAINKQFRLFSYGDLSVWTRPIT